MIIHFFCLLIQVLYSDKKYNKNCLKVQWKLSKIPRFFPANLTRRWSDCLFKIRDGLICNKFLYATGANKKRQHEESKKCRKTANHHSQLP